MDTRTPTTRAVCAERTVTLPRPHPLNALRRLLRRPVPTYTAHLFADAVVHAADEPTLAIELVDERHVQVRFTWPGTFGGVTTRLSVRERGANRFLPGVREVHDFPRLELEARVREAVTAGRISPNGARSVLAGDMTMGEAMARASDTLRTRNDSADALAYALTAPAFAAPPLNPPWDRFTPLPGDPTPPTESTTVLHDLAFIADQLELAQTQVAMSDGGVGAGSMDNGAHVALCGLGIVRAKLDVVADAADLAAAEVMGAQARLNEAAGDHGPAKQCLNRSRAMLRQVTTALPLNPTESRLAPV